MDDLDDAYRIARENGWEIVHDLAVEEWGVRRFFFRDADGNIVKRPVSSVIPALKVHRVVLCRMRRVGP